MRELKFNVLSHEVKATKGQNGHSEPLPEIKHEPQTFWERMVARLPSPEEIIVTSRVVTKGIVLTPTMALTLFLALGTVAGTLYWRMNDRIDAKDRAYQEQHDLLIRIETELRLSKERDEQRFEQLERRFESVEAWQDVTNKDLAKLGLQRN